MGLDGFFKCINRGPVVIPRQPTNESLCARDFLPRSEILRRTRERANSLRGQQMRFDSCGNAAGNRVLHAKDVAKFTVVALSPVVPTSRCIHELCANAQPIS